MSDPADHFRTFLLSLGLDPKEDRHLANTPQRVCAMLEELFSTVGEDAPIMSVFDAEPSGKNGAIIVAGIPFRSMCVHHFVPFFGTIDIAYVPDERLSGFGSFGRIVEWAAKRPQIQERMVSQIADVLEAALQPAGLLVRCRARQMCVEMRTGRPGTYVSLSSTGALEAGGAHFDSVIRQLTAADTPL